MIKMNRFLVIVTLFSCIVFLSSFARADVIFSSFGPGDPADLSEGWVIGAFSEKIPGVPNVLQRIAASFTPGANYTLNSIDLALWNLESLFPSLDVNLMSGASAPDTLIGTVQITVPSGSHSGVFTANFLSNISLTSGTTYWVMLSPTDMVNSEMLWDWSDPITTGGVSASLDGGPWTSISNSFQVGAAFINGGSLTAFTTGLTATPSFAVYGTPVPEPSTMLLLGSGLIGLVGYGRKKFFKK